MEKLVVNTELKEQMFNYYKKFGNGKILSREIERSGAHGILSLYSDFSDLRRDVQKDLTGPVWSVAGHTCLEQLLLIIDIFLPYLDKIEHNSTTVDKFNVKVLAAHHLIQGRELAKLFIRQGWALLLNLRSLVLISSTVPELKDKYMGYLTRLRSSWFWQINHIPYKGLVNYNATSLEHLSAMVDLANVLLLAPHVATAVAMAQQTRVTSLLQNGTGIRTEIGVLVINKLAVEPSSWLSVLPCNFVQYLWSQQFLKVMPVIFIRKFKEIIEKSEEALKPITYKKINNNEYQLTVEMKPGEFKIMKLEINDFMDTRIDGKSILEI